MSAALLLAVLIGISLGALGSGGSIITMPVLVYVAGIDPKSAVGMSLAIVGMTSVAGAYLHFRRGNFYAKAAVVFALAGMPGAYVGALFTHRVPSSVLMLVFAGLMLVIGTLMLVRRSECAGEGRCILWRCILAGVAVGTLTGFLGVGGGFLIVPALVYTSGLSTKQAVGTSLAIIAVNSVTGLVGQLSYITIDWRHTAEFLVAALAGMGLGVLGVRRIPERALRVAFAVALLGVGLAVGWKNAV